MRPTRIREIKMAKKTITKEDQQKEIKGLQKETFVAVSKVAKVPTTATSGTPIKRTDAVSQVKKPVPEVEIKQILQQMQLTTRTKYVNAVVKRIPKTELEVEQSIHSQLKLPYSPQLLGTVHFYDKTIAIVQGNSYKLEVRQTIPNATLTWTCDDKDEIVTVSDSGIVKTKNITGQRHAATITVTREGGKDTCTVWVVDKFIADATGVGTGIDVTKAQAFADKELKKSPVFDMDLIYAMNLWGQREDTNTRFNTEAGTTIKETIKEFNNAATVTASMPLVFSAKVDVSFKSASSSVRTSGFTRAQAQVRTRNDFLRDVNPGRLKEYITDNFKKDLLSRTAADMVNTYGTHVVANCFYGGVVQLDFTTASSTITSASDLKIHVEAKAFGMDAKNTTEFKNQQKDFTDHSVFSIYVDGGALGATNLDGFYNNFAKWEREVKNGYLNVLCGADGYDENFLIPLWKIAEQVSSAKAIAIKNETDNRIIACETLLNNMKVSTPFLTDITVHNTMGTMGASLPLPPEGVIAGYTHAVLRNFTDMKNDKAYLESESTPPDKLIFGFNSVGIAGAALGTAPYITSTYYKAQQLLGMTTYENAIRNLWVADELRGFALIAQGYKRSSNPIARSSTSGLLYLYYKTAESHTDEAIDFIGGFTTSSSNTLPPLPLANAQGRWFWVGRYLSQTQNSPAKLYASFNLTSISNQYSCLLIHVSKIS